MRFAPAPLAAALAGSSRERGARSGRSSAGSPSSAALALLNYASRARRGKPPKDELYTWGLAAIGARAVRRRARRSCSLIAAARPARPARAAAAALVERRARARRPAHRRRSRVLSAALDPLLHAGREQGLTPSHWQPRPRAAVRRRTPLVIVVVAPIVEELLFRGLGYSVLDPVRPLDGDPRRRRRVRARARARVRRCRSSSPSAPALAYLRDRTDSVYPGMLVHASYNAVALTLSVTT